MQKKEPVSDSKFSGTIPIMMSRKRRFNVNESSSESEEEQPATKILVEEAPYSLLSFSDEVLLEIFRHLDTNSLYSIKNTCLRLFNLIKDRRLWKNVDLTSIQLSHKEIRTRLQGITNETESIRLCGMTGSFPAKTWNDVTLNNNFLKNITETCENLQVLELFNSFLNFESMRITDFPKTLRRIVFNHCFVRWPRAPHIFFTRIDTHFLKLEELFMEYCNWFETHDLIMFSKIPSLKKLSLRGCTNLRECVPYGSIATRFGFKKLEYLDVRDTMISDSDIQCFNITLTLKELLLECPTSLRGGDSGGATSREDTTINTPDIAAIDAAERQRSMEDRLNNTREENNGDPRAAPNRPNNTIQIVIDRSLINMRPRPNVEVQPQEQQNEEPPNQEQEEEPQAEHGENELREEQNEDNVPAEGEAPANNIHVIGPLRIYQQQEGNNMYNLNMNNIISRSLWFERRYPPPFSAIQTAFPISDRGICGFGAPRNHVQPGVIWIRAEARPPDHNLKKLVVRHYKLVTDVSLSHLIQCSPHLVYLDLTGTSVTKEGVEKFKQEKPECFVISDHFTG